MEERSEEKKERKQEPFDRRAADEWRNVCNTLAQEVRSALHVTYVSAAQQKTGPAATWLRRAEDLAHKGRERLPDHPRLKADCEQTLRTLDACIRRAALAKGALDAVDMNGKKVKHWQELKELALSHSQDEDVEESELIVKRVIAGRLNRYLRSVCADFHNILTFSSAGCCAKIEIDVSDPERLHEVMNALACSERIAVELNDFARFLTEEVFPPLILAKCEVVVKTDPRKVSVLVHRDEDGRRATLTETVDGAMAFFDVVQGAIDCRWEDDRTVFSILGGLVRREFFELVERRLADETFEGGPTEESPRSEIARLENYLCEIRFIDEKDSPLSSHATASARNSRRNRMRNWLEKMRSIIETDPRANVVRAIGKERDAKISEQTEAIGGKGRKRRNVTESPHLFPECSVSGNVVTILSDIVRVLAEAFESPAIDANEAVMSVRRAVEMYSMLVPKFHGEALRSNPVDLALFYNNSFYLAHGLLGYPWKSAFDGPFADNINSVFGDVIQNVRSAAVSKFSAFIQSQRRFIRETLTGCELNDLNKIEHITNDSEAAIEACMERLKYLNDSWKPILPADTLKRTMINLCDVVAKDMIDILMNVKDRILGESLTEEVHRIFAICSDGLSSLRDANDGMDVQSGDWSRFTELTILLNSPMFAIATEWNEEKGRLSKLFSQEEVKHIVRIVFSPNKQKSVVLNMIR